MIQKNKIDPRITRTKKAIENALFDLLETRDYDQIQINDIIEVAGYSKQAFYLHYKSKNDLCEKIIKDILNKDIGVLELYIKNHPKIGESKQELYGLYFEYLGNMLAEKRKNNAMHRYSCFRSFSLKFINRIISVEMPIPFFNYKQKRYIDFFNYISAYYLNVILGFWLDNDFQPSKEELSTFIVKSAYGPGSYFELYASKDTPFIAHSNIDIAAAKKNNNRVIKQYKNSATFEDFKTALIELIAGNQKISVRSISKKAGYSRTSFYNHFYSVSDLIEKTIDSEIEYLCGVIKKNLKEDEHDNKNIKKLATQIFRQILKKKKFYVAFFQNSTYNSFSTRTIKAFNELNIPPVQLNKVPFLNEELSVVITSYLLFGTIQWYVIINDSISPEQVAHLYVKAFYQ